jgi:beta-N-acetylhexosaminidase
MIAFSPQLGYNNAMIKRWLSLAFVAMIILGFTPSLQAQEDDIAARLLERMSPAARVGQLFLVTFSGTSLEEFTPIYDLIVNEQIGGVLLRPENGNIVNEGNTPTQVATLSNELQRLAWSGEEPYVPLFVAVEQQEEAGFYSTTIVSGTTSLPSPMAIGATWDRSHAATAGRIAGEELTTMGINMLIGPSLDVLNTLRPGSAADLGVRSFGGDPYWVGQMGTAYIGGIREGSQGRLAVIASHFPGLGAADRPLSEEVSTVQKVLEQLKQIELAPFFAATQSSEPSEHPDGMLISHISYRGFQGNIYQSTKPVSFDPQALQALMTLPEIAPWRENGGLTIADDLGVRAVQRFYDPTEQTFNHLRVAREAFAAGNDLLIVSQFALDTGNWEAQAANIKATLAFFREKYATDPTFQAQVDESVLRILRLKLDLYDSSTASMTLSTALVDEQEIAERVGHGQEQIAPVAQRAVTLLSPPSPDLRPAPPAVDEWIVIFTDDRQFSPCADCTPTYAIPPAAMRETLIRLYGPQTTNQVSPERVSSFTFSQLMTYLAAPPTPVETPEPEVGETPQPGDPLTTALEQADWVIFNMLDITDNDPSSNAVRRFLSEQTNLLRNKNVVVFAFGAPYYLDATEVAKLQAYFGLYSHTEPFIEAAIRALFDEFPFTGASPVSVPGINYDLIAQTEPDPSQMIQIVYEVVSSQEEETPTPEETATPEATPEMIEIHQGDTLRLRTNVIVDQNGHRVPDGTPVDFIFTYPQEGLGLEHSVQVTTRDGVAETTTTLNQVGQLQISVQAAPVPRAVRLEMDIREGEPVNVITPTPTATPIPTPTATPTEVPTPGETPTPSQQIGEEPETNGEDWDLRWIDLLLGLTTTALVASSGYGLRWWRKQSTESALRAALWCAAGGLTAYLAMALRAPGTDWIRQQAGDLAVVVVALVGAAVPWITTLLAEISAGEHVQS